MAISVTASSMLISRSEHKAITFCSSHLNSLRQLPCLRTAFPPTNSLKHRPRTLPLVEAKKKTFTSFEKLLNNSDKPVLVDFYATWCGPCQFMVPILNEVEESMQGKIKIVKIDTEKYPDIADKYKIQALPTFIVFKDGEPCERFEGALSADQLTKRVETALEA